MRTVVPHVVIVLFAMLLAGCVAPEEVAPGDLLSTTPVDPASLNASAVRSGALNGTDRPVVLIPTEPVVQTPYEIVLVAPDVGTWTLTTPDWAVTVRSDTRSGQVTVPAHDVAAPIQLDWTFKGDDEKAKGFLRFDVWGIPLEFPDEPTDAQVLRPGLYSEVCTTNYLFQYKWQRIFIGSAAHCMDSEESPDAACSQTQAEIGENETLEGDIQVTHAYSSWTTMNRFEECIDANDFGLFEVPKDQWTRLHPKGYGIIGHVSGLGDCRDLEPSPAYGGSGTALEIKGYGRSSLRHGVLVQGTPDRAWDNKVGEFLEADNDGYQCHVYMATPGIPGDSGGPIATMDGLALGAASTVTIYPTVGSNHYTNIAAALEFMRQHEGWAPELIPSGS